MTRLTVCPICDEYCDPADYDPAAGCIDCQDEPRTWGEAALNVIGAVMLFPVLYIVLVIVLGG